MVQAEKRGGTGRKVCLPAKSLLSRTVQYSLQNNKFRKFTTHVSS